MSDSHSPIVVDEYAAAEMLSLSVSMIRKMRRTGQLPAVKFGRSVRYSVDDLRALASYARQAAA
jgi:excisionase family DNA binding protein